MTWNPREQRDERDIDHRGLNLVASCSRRSHDAEFGNLLLAEMEAMMLSTPLRKLPDKEGAAESCFGH